MTEQLLLPFSQPLLTKKNLYYSRFFNKLEESLKSQIAEIKDPDPLKPVIVAAPSGIAGFRLRMEIRGGGITLLNLKQLAEKIGKDHLNQSGLREIPSLGENLSARKAVKEVITADSPLYPFIRSRGLLTVFLSLLKDFRQGGFDRLPSEDELALKMEKAGGGLVDGERLKTVFRLLNRYREGFIKKYFDVEDIISKASEMADSFNKAAGTDFLCIYGFDTLDQAQKLLVREVSKHAETSVFLPIQPDNPISFEMLSFYRETGFHFHDLDSVLPMDDTPLGRVRGGLFENRHYPGPVNDDGSLLILSCPSPLQEADETARHIIKLASEGVPFDRMAVVFSGDQLYRSIFTDRFDQLGIPYYLHMGPPLIQTPSGRTLTLLLELAGSNLPRFEVMELFTSGILDFGRFLESEEAPAAAKWEILSRRAGIREGKIQWQRRLANLKSTILERQKTQSPDEVSDEETDRNCREIETLMDTIKKLSDILSGLSGRNSWRNFSRAVTGICKSYFQDDGHLPALLELLETMESLDRLDTPVSFDEFKSFLKERLETAFHPAGEPGSGSVCFFTGGLPSGLIFDCIFLPGMLAGNYPSVIKENPLMRDREREIFNRIIGGKRKLIQRQDLERRDQLLFSLMVRSGLKKVVLLYPRRSPKGEDPGVPSSWLMEIASILVGDRVFFSRLDQVPGFTAISRSSSCSLPPHESLDQCEYLTRASSCYQGPKNKLFRDMAEIDESFRKSLICHYNRWHRDIFTAYDGRITNPELIDSMAPLLEEFFRGASASGFEKYHTCPYSFFLRRVLQLNILEAPEDKGEISPRDRGALYHEIFCRFYRDLKAEALLPLCKENFDEYLKKIKGTAQEEFLRIFESGLTGSRSSWFEKMVEIRKGLEKFVEKEIALNMGSLIPDRFEFSFGMEGDENPDNLPPSEISADNNIPVRFRGRIDRLDMDRERQTLGIIDYKTGRAKYEKESLAGGKQLQLPIYLLSLLQLLNEPIDPLNSWACYYYATPRGNFTRHYFTGTQLQEKSEEIKSLLAAVIEGTNKGIFIPYPGKTETDRDGNTVFENCQYCDFRIMCPVDAGGLFRKKEKDPDIQFFKESKEIK